MCNETAERNRREQRRTGNLKRKKKATEGNDGYNEEERNHATDEESPREDKRKGLKVRKTIRNIQTNYHDINRQAIQDSSDSDEVSDDT